MIILALSRPKEEANTAMDNMKQTTKLTRDLERRSSKICALALSSESQGVWINSFGPIAFCKLILSYASSTLKHAWVTLT